MLDESYFLILFIAKIFFFYNRGNSPTFVIASSEEFLLIHLTLALTELAPLISDWKGISHHSFCDYRYISFCLVEVCAASKVLLRPRQVGYIQDGNKKGQESFMEILVRKRRRVPRILKVQAHSRETNYLTFIDYLRNEHAGWTLSNYALLKQRLGAH